MRLLVACERINLAGGLFRFERVGRVLRGLGHELAWLTLDSGPNDRPTEFPLLTLEDASNVGWDATMVPGAGFKPQTIQALGDLRQAGFGVRVQHLLNDQSRKSKFLEVNRSFRPHLVVSNNRDWSDASLADFRARHFAFLEGAVDFDMFQRVHRRSNDPRFVIGGLANKNPWPLLDAVRALPPVFEVKLFGNPKDLASRASDLIREGRLKLLGPLPEQDLPNYYSTLDCVVHAESAAGWANLAAEAMAAGVPLICTNPGTRAFAENGVTAIVLDGGDSEQMAAAIWRLHEDKELAQRLSMNGRARISRFTWNNYTADLLDLIERERTGHQLD